MRTLNEEEIKDLKTKLEKLTKKQGIKRLRAAIYARKSTADEKETSIPTQISLCKQFIKDYSFIEHKATFSEDDRSGMFMDNREQFLSMLNMVEKRRNRRNCRFAF